MSGRSSIAMPRWPVPRPAHRRRAGAVARHRSPSRARAAHPLVEDNAPHAELVEHFLRESGLQFSLHRVETREAYLAALEREPPDMILSDYALPPSTATPRSRSAREKAPHVPFIFVTGTMGEEVAIETLKNGATDYVLKTRLGRLARGATRLRRGRRPPPAQRRGQASALPHLDLFLGEENILGVFDDVLRLPVFTGGFQPGFSIIRISRTPRGPETPSTCRSGRPTIR